MLSSGTKNNIGPPSSCTWSTLDLILLHWFKFKYTTQQHEKPEAQGDNDETSYFNVKLSKVVQDTDNLAWLCLLHD